jgi:RNA polymerase sigma factor (sigma-70 family)
MNDDTEEIFKREMTRRHRRLTAGQIEDLHDAKGYEELLNSVMPLIYGHAKQLIHVRGWACEALDLVQEASMAVMEALPRYEPGRARLSTFVWTVADRAMHKHLAREIRQTRLLVPIFDARVDAEETIGYLDAAHTVNAEEEAVADDVEGAIALEKAMQTLSEKQRDVFNLYLEGFTCREIAERMQLGKSYVGRILQAGGDKIAAQL